MLLQWRIISFPRGRDFVPERILPEQADQGSPWQSLLSNGRITQTLVLFPTKGWLWISLSVLGSKRLFVILLKHHQSFSVSQATSMKCLNISGDSDLDLETLIYWFETSLWEIAGSSNLVWFEMKSVAPYLFPVFLFETFQSSISTLNPIE
jgi:hypothetical protein